MTADDDRALAEQGRRLALSAELTHRAGRCAAAPSPARPEAGAGPAADAGAGPDADPGTGGEPARDPDPLVALARRVAGVAGPVGRAHHLTFAPAYPGVTGGVEQTSGGRRLVLACTALDADGRAVAVVFTTLIAGRAPQVAAAPAHTPVPAEWRRLDEH